jgi:hypothetical protein
MMENLLEYYRKSDGATKKKIPGGIFSEKLVLENGPPSLKLRLAKQIAELSGSVTFLAFRPHDKKCQ